jgi:hypothetical protein
LQASAITPTREGFVMAEFQTWERGVMPQGSIVAPHAGPSLAESFGHGLSDLARAAGGAASAMRKADELQAAKQWEIDQPKAAALVNQLELQIAEQLPELKAQAAPGLADYPDKINEAITRATEDALKEISDPRFQRYVRGYMDEFRVSSVTVGIREKTAATLARDADALQHLLDGRSERVADDFGAFDPAVSLVADTISSNRYLTADQKAELILSSKRSLAVAGMRGLVDRDANAALQVIESGKLDGILDAAEQENLLADIKSEQERKSLETTIAENNRLQAAHNDLDARLKIAFQQALSTGKYDKVTRTEIIQLYGEQAGSEIVADLDNARYMGQDALAIAQQTSRSDSQLLRMLSRVASEHKDDQRAQDRLKSAQDFISKKRAGLKNDPEDWVRTNTPSVRDAWDAFAKAPNEDTASLALETATQAQLKHGVAKVRVDPIPQKIADGIFQDVRERGPAAIGYYQKILGDYFPHLIGKLVKNGPLSTAALMLDQPAQAPTQAALLDLSRDSQPVVKMEQILAIDDQRRADIQKLVFGNLDKLRQSYANQPGGETAFSNLAQSAYALTLRHMSLDHMSDRQAAATAAAEIGMNQYAFDHTVGKVYRIPRNASPHEVMKGANFYFSNLINLPLDPPDDAPSMPREKIASSLWSSGYWVNLPGDRGLKLVFATGQPATAAGEEITLTWSELAQAAIDFAPE